jgi:hypothetical protein
MTPSGIDPATFRFAAQCLNHCVAAGPRRNEHRDLVIDEISHAIVTVASSYDKSAKHVMARADNQEHI